MGQGKKTHNNNKKNQIKTKQKQITIVLSPHGCSNTTLAYVLPAVLEHLLKS